MRAHHTRRAVLGAAIAAAGAGVLAACSDSSGTGHGSMNHGGSTPTATPQDYVAPDTPEGYVAPDGPEVLGYEEARGSGPVRSFKLTATATPLELGGGRTVKSWAYGDRLPGQEVRLTAGETLALTLANNLPQDTSLHCHGISMRNDMDGVPGVTQQPIRPGAEFTYRFVAAHPGTYWFHPHSGVQLDRGMYAPLIVEDPKEPLSYDKEWVVLLDDWVDGIDGSTPDSVLAELRKGMGHGSGHHGHGSSTPSGSATATASGSPSPESRPSGPPRLLRGTKSNLLGGEAGDVAYPHYLINGRTPDDPSQFIAKPGDRIRLRIINAGGETAFRVALGGHRLTVTHTDGFPVLPTETDALLVAMGERYDVLVTAEDGVFPLTALAEGKKASSMAVLRTGGGELPAPSVRPAELDRKVLKSAARLEPDESVAFSRRRPDRIMRIKLTGGMEKYDWAFDDEPYSPDRLYSVRDGERVRMVFINATDMWHPIHLHGHTFALAGINGSGARKDTAAVLPHRKVTVDFDADNPGLWMLHCHNIYHSESGMMTTVAYRE
ncbi:multicopper oxidase family protein [Streptomyces sp. V1I1]|uniref:multicopper oxidase family protein n=1 Tax=Streptomyces sp. V1I1 TaxID=3042272 RepID=UPI002780A5FA|nr:multicopper oxidase family protein [Streptomyces sp. V1I1]MDQ0943949.1 FtsP/CotA-like multicopper oxidase with cupredoxin domain [Streptomyces sp. V1I1]